MKTQTRDLMIVLTVVVVMSAMFLVTVIVVEKERTKQVALCGKGN